MSYLDLPGLARVFANLKGKFDGKQNTITATGATNLLTAPPAPGDQPGTLATSTFAAAATTYTRTEVNGLLANKPNTVNTIPPVSGNITLPASNIPYQGTNVGAALDVQSAALSALETALPNKLDKTSTASQSLSGPVVAGGTQALGTAQVRNVIMSTTDLTAGTSPLAAGTVYLFYEV